VDLISKARFIDVDGGINFRDAGGYGTADGGYVKRGLLYRCGHLADLSDAGRGSFTKLNIRLVCDLRADEERDVHPHPVFSESTHELVQLSIWPKSTPDFSRTVQLLAEGNITFDEALARQSLSYSELVKDFSYQYKAMFQHIVQAAGDAVLIHCASGKDRTGFGIALIQLALGVPVSSVMEDYMLSNEATGTADRVMYFTRRFANGVSPEQLEAIEEQIQILFAARRERLQAAFDTIISRYHSFETYFSSVLGIDTAARQLLKQSYVQAG